MLEPGFVVTSPRGTVVEVLENRALQAGDVMEVPAGSAHVHPHTDA